MSDPTPFPTVNVLLADLLAQMRPILGGDLIGLYLDGSLALGDFDPATSDVDFIAAIARPLSAAQSDALAAMHRQMRDSGRPFATELEGSYIPRPALRRHDPADATFANLERGSDEVLKYKTHHSDWVIHRTTVREHGIALFGPPPATLIDPVSPDDVRRATTEVLRSWWGTADAVATIHAAPPGGLSFIALTMCRALYALERGEVVSKRAAAEWALRTQDPRWRPLIERSLRWELSGEMKDEMIALVYSVATRT
jgi:hypothetical protein